MRINLSDRLKGVPDPTAMLTLHAVPQPNRSLPLLTVLALAVVLCVIGTPVRAEMIQGGITHKEELPPVPSEYQAGAVLNNANPVMTVQWFPVPDWLSGAWIKDGDVETFAKDFTTGRESTQQVWLTNRVRLAFGHQVDALGTVWHAELLPFRADGNRGQTQDRRYVMQMSCLNSSPQSVALNFHSIVTVVDPSTNKVLDSKQQEEIVTFQPSVPNVIATHSSTKGFSSGGQALLQYETHTQRKKIAAFSPVYEDRGINLQQSLAQFLTQKNMLNRLPKGAQDQSN